MDGGAYSTIARPDNHISLMEPRANSLAVRMRERNNARCAVRIRRREQIESQFLNAVPQSGNDRTHLAIDPLHARFEQEFDAPAQDVYRWERRHAGAYPPGAWLEFVTLKPIGCEDLRHRVPPERARTQPVARGGREISHAHSVNPQKPLVTACNKKIDAFQCQRQTAERLRSVQHKQGAG